MISKGVYTRLGSIACPIDQCQRHAMIPRGVEAFLAITACHQH